MNKKILFTLALFFSLTPGVLATDHVPPGPGVNIQSCSDSNTHNQADGNLACYGIWDYGRAFGGDSDVCRDGNGGLSIGCVVSTSICTSGIATATASFRPNSLSLSSNELITIATNLQVSAEIAQEHIAGLSVYTCGTEIPPDPLPNPTPVQVPPSGGSSTPKGRYTSFINENPSPYSSQESISRATAFRNCESERLLLADTSFSCFWNEEKIYSFTSLIKENNTKTGIYRGFISESSTASFVKKNISETDALVQCKLNHANTPSLSFSCLWNNIEIYNVTGEKVIYKTCPEKELSLDSLGICVGEKELVYYKILRNKFGNIISEFSLEKLEMILTRIQTLSQNSTLENSLQLKLIALKIIIQEAIQKQKD